VVEAAAQLRQDERAWWLRTLLVLSNPREVFAALRDDSDEAAEARQEPLVAVVFLAGVGIVLSTTVAERLLNDPQFDALLVLVWAVVAGAGHGAVAYFLVGGVVYLAASFAGGLGTYRRARHLLGYASVPVALTVLLAPVRVALYGEDAFRRRGADEGATGTAILDALEAGLLVWALVLVAIGIRTVHGWSWPRALAATSPLALLLAFGLARAHGLV
jgi:hypothetical protein